MNIERLLVGCSVILVVAICLWSYVLPDGFSQAATALCRGVRIFCVSPGAYADEKALTNAGYPAYAVGFSALRRVVPLLVVVEIVLFLITRVAAKASLESRSNTDPKQAGDEPSLNAMLALILFSTFVVGYVFFNPDFYLAGFRTELEFAAPPVGTIGLGAAVLFIAGLGAVLIVLAVRALGLRATGQRRN